MDAVAAPEHILDPELAGSPNLQILQIAVPFLVQLLLSQVQSIVVDRGPPTQEEIVVEVLQFLLLVGVERKARIRKLPKIPVEIVLYGCRRRGARTLHGLLQPR